MQASSLGIYSVFNEGEMRVLIVGFQMQVRAMCLGWLKRGFRHCFTYLEGADGWLLCDPMSDRVLLQDAPALPSRALMSSLAALGASVVRGEFDDCGGTVCWLRPLTCVEICKRIVGCNQTWVITPHQLFSHLAHRSEKWR